MSENEIRDLLAERTAAMHAKDARRVVASYAEKAVKFDLAPPLRTTGASEDYVAQWFSTFDGPISYTYHDEEITVSGDLAVVAALAKLTATPRGESESFALWFRSTFALRRSGNGWLIAHEHNSTPFHMDGSFRAAVDLQP
ncbi:YybH family protein [Amycolatopsis echigonensis]|uniref:Ketosteroid isomerase-like protein n=1 Tax=Amycolatopsis echigonensis TaxID=2576905 RepID=A0A2N3WHS3_9PSEU|nr:MULTISPECIES: nuclear transport factor 2 family protein [Amycolatopsis]MBB2504537.1 nuclear transport factor 2 family protein [Amycolatopsis echigonensis]PKV93419.1 ketosteroid isomerase-like protein [Amycolatopsis niigatensis]